MRDVNRRRVDAAGEGVEIGGQLAQIGLECEAKIANIRSG